MKPTRCIVRLTAVATCSFVFSCAQHDAPVPAAQHASVCKHTVEWGKQLGTTEDDSLHGVAIDSQDNVYVAGVTHGVMGERSFGGADAVLLKFSSDGSELLRTQLGSDGEETAKSVVCDSDDSVVLIGSTTGTMGATAAGGNDVWIVKLSSTGEQRWLTQLGSDKDDEGSALVTDENNNIFVTGGTRGRMGAQTLGDSDAFVTKLGPDGAVVWTVQMGTDQYDVGQGLALDSAGRVFVVTGYYKSPISSIVIVSQDGSVIKQQVMHDESFSDVFINTDDEVFVTSWAGSTSKFVKMTASLEPLWSKEFSRGNWTGEKKIVPLAGGSYATSGCMNWPDCYGFVRVYDAAGTVQDLVQIRRSLAASETQTTCGELLAVDSTGALYHVGITTEDLYGPSHGKTDGFLAKVTLG